MKKCISFALVLCMVLTALVFVPAAEIKAGAAAYNINGGTQTTATFIIDPGHKGSGGGDPGACALGRQEADDVLAISLKIGRLIINSGESVSFTRVTDLNQSLSAKCSQQKNGNFKYFVSVHRNAGGGTGVETFYNTNKSGSYELAEAINTRIANAVGWRNRGVKNGNHLAVINGTTVPQCLIELGFIDTAADNTVFVNQNDAIAKAVANGMLSRVNKSVTDPKTVTAPSVTVGTAAAYSTSVSVSWGAVTNATSYKYKVVSYAGEMSATSASTLVSETSTTGKSFSFTTPASGKYCKVTVIAVGPNNTATTTKTIMIGPWVGYPTTMQYIPVYDVNGDQWTTGGSTVWTSAKGSTFSAVWWTAALCSANSDGSYTVSSVYAAGGSSKSVTVSGKNILLATHSSEANHKYTAALKAGDKITLHGVYLDNSTLRGTGYALVNGGVSLAVGTFTASAPASVKYGETATVTWSASTNATSYNYTVTNGSTTVANASGVTNKTFTIPAQTSGSSLTVTITAVGPCDSKSVTKTITLVNPAPTDITTGNSSIKKVSSGSTNAFKGFVESTTVNAVLGFFQQDNSFLRVCDKKGNEVETGAVVATGYTVSVVDNGKVTVTYTLVVNGDVSGDGNVTSSDYISVRTSMSGQVSLNGAETLAADVNSDEQISATDYVALMTHLAGTSSIYG